MKTKSSSKLSVLLAVLGLLLIAPSCDLSKPQPAGYVDQSTQLKVVTKDGLVTANPYTVRSEVISDPAVAEIFYKLSVFYYKPTESDHDIVLKVAQEEVQAQMTSLAREYKIMPSEYVEILSQPKVKQGSTYSSDAEIAVHIFDGMEANVPYLFGIKLADPGEGNVLHGSDIVFFSVERYEASDEIFNVTRIDRNLYFDLAKSFPGGQSALTIEGLVNVEKFRSASDVGEAQISTLIGIEGGTLLRFGDAGVPGNKLQAAGVEIPTPFATDKWYHIAFVYENGRKIVYVNGEEVSNVRGYASLTGGNPFLIGRSYSDNRGIQARLSEFRVWTIARSKAQIQDGMYKVDPASAGLLAYWGFNKAEDDRVSDLTGNGYDLLLKGQNEKTGKQTVDIVTEKFAVSISD